TTQSWKWRRENFLARKRKTPVWIGKIFKQHYPAIRDFRKKNGIRLSTTVCRMLGLWRSSPKKRKGNLERSAFRLKTRLVVRRCPFGCSKKRWISVLFRLSATKWPESRSGAA